jgi:hypothetical protein
MSCSSQIKGPDFLPKKPSPAIGRAMKSIERYNKAIYRLITNNDVTVVMLNPRKEVAKR